MDWLREERFYLIVLLLLILILALRSPLDSDMWWHLRAGEETVTSGSVYRYDTLSYTRTGSPWINHSWLSQVIMYELFMLGSFRAISFWVGLTALGMMLFLYLQLEGGPIMRMGITLLAAFIVSVVWSPRPQIFSLLLFSLVSWMIYQYKWAGKDYLVWSLPIFILWSNLHGGYILGIIFIFSIVIGEIVNLLLGAESDSNLMWAGILKLTLIGFAGFALSAVNPNGFDMWKIPFQTIGVESLQNLIQEWASPDFHQPVQQLMLILLFGTFAVVGLSRRKVDGSDLASFVVFGILALTARRNFGPFAVVAAPILARHLDELLPVWQERLGQRWAFIKLIADRGNVSKKEINRSIQLGINLFVVLALVIAAGYKWIAVSDPQFVMDKEKEIFPQEAAAWVVKEMPEGNLFSIYNWGGYLTWKVREYPVFVDGRTDLYGDEIINEYLQVETAADGWETVLDRYRVRTMLVKPDSGISKIAPTEGWKPIYQDSVAVILTKP